MILIIILIIVLILIIVSSLFINKKNIENFNLRCKQNINRTNFCTWNINAQTCYCSYQPGLAHTNFPQNPSCCDRKCNMLSEEECQRLPETKYNNINYYCPIDGVCKKVKGYTRDRMISANICGYNKLNYQTIYPSLTKSDCEKRLDSCSLNNNPKYSNNQKRQKCLEDDFCGWCTNSQDVGQCISGTASGPINIYKYNFCKLNKQGTNSYVHKSSSQI